MNKAHKQAMSLIDQEMALGKDRLWKDIDQLKLDIHNTYLKLLMMVNQREELLSGYWIDGSKLVMRQILAGSTHGLTDRMLVHFKYAYKACYENMYWQYRVLKNAEKNNTLHTFLEKLEGYEKHKPTSEFERRWRAAVECEKSSNALAKILYDTIVKLEPNPKLDGIASLKLLPKGNSCFQRK